MSGVAAPDLNEKQAEKILNAVLARLKSVRVGPQHLAPGTAMVAKLVPTAAEIDASDLVNAAIDVAGIAKDVLFANAGPLQSSFTDANQVQSFDGFTTLSKQPAAVEGGKPFVSPLVGALPAATPNHILGLLAQLFGIVQAPNLKVSIDLLWTVCDENGVPMQEGRDFVAPGGLTSPEVSILVMPPGARELRFDTLLNPGGTPTCLWLTVTLTLGAKKIGPVDLPPLQFVRLPLLLPSFVALFNEPNFEVTHDSAVLLVVPEGSPLSSIEPLFKTLKSVEAATDALRSIGGMAGFFLGLDEVLGAIPTQPRLRFASAKQGDSGSREDEHNLLRNLGNFTIKRRPWYDVLGSDQTFNDTVQSLLVFGGAGLEVEFFNSGDFKKPGQGWFTVKLNDVVAAGSSMLPDCFVAIRSLYVDDVDPPSTVPPGRAAKANSASGTEEEYSWDKDMSSLRFSRKYMDAVRKDEGTIQLPPLFVCKPRQPPRTHGNPGGAGQGRGRSRKKDIGDGKSNSGRRKR